MENSNKESRLIITGTLEFKLEENTDFVPRCSSIINIPRIGVINKEINWYITKKNNLRISSECVSFLQGIKAIYFVKVTIGTNASTVAVDSEIKIPVDPVENAYKIEFQFLDQYKSENSFCKDTCRYLQIDDKFSDVTLACLAGGTLNAHKCILSARSKFFKRIFELDSVESNTVECEFNINVMKGVLDFLYSYLVNHTLLKELLVAADFFEIEALKLTCEAEFHINEKNAVSSIIFAHQNKAEYLKNRALHFIREKSREVVDFEELLELSDKIGVNTMNMDLVKLIFDAAAVRNSLLAELPYPKEATLSCHRDSFRDDLLSLLQEERLTDITLECENGTVKAHKCVLAARSIIFEKMFQPETVESKTNVVNCAFEIDVMKALLEHLYLDSILSDKKDVMMVSWDLLIAADYYGIFKLKSKIESDIFHTCVNTENAISTLISAHQYNADFLKWQILYYIRTYSEEVIKADEISKLPEELDKLDTELLQHLLVAVIPK